MHTKRWLVSKKLTPEADQNLKIFPEILRQILFNRGYATDPEARAYLKAELDFNDDPFQMKNMAQAVERIWFAIDNQEPIAIYGDYDVDGVTATALMVDGLQALGANVREYIPNRFEEGYGLNNEALTYLKESGIKLVISVDCGIRSPVEAKHAREINLDLIISDHHHPDADLPNAFALINPKQPGDEYPDKDLAGVGVAYKIMQALLDRRGKTEDRAERSTVNGLPSDLLDLLMDLVALGTVADLAPLAGENRVLVRRGLRQIRATTRQGLYSLAQVAEIDIKKATAMNIGFGFGPRLNASGRLESALASFELLTTKDVMKAGQLAQQLDGQNRSRQTITRQIQDQADVMVREENPNAALMFAVDPSFNSGVVGLAASRLVETYYRPAVVGQVSEDTTRCSCRSIPEFHITDALDKCKDLLVRHGGHAAAAGFTVKNENLSALKERLLAIASEALKDQDLRPTLAADAVVKLSELNFELLKYLDYLQPSGYGNPEPLFVVRGVQVKSARTVGADNKHLKLSLADGKTVFDAIGFRLGHLRESLPAYLDLLFAFESNTFNGRTNLQLNLKDIKQAGTPD